VTRSDRRARAALLALALLAAGGAPAAAGPGGLDWSCGPGWRCRLLLAAPPGGGLPDSGLAIEGENLAMLEGLEVSRLMAVEVNLAPLRALARALGY
jgi:hypothetical protein